MSTSVCLCLSLCVSVGPQAYLPNSTRDFYQFIVHVAYRRGSVLLRLGDAIPRGTCNFGGFFPIDNALCGPYSGMNFATKDRFRLNLLIYRNVDQNSIPDY